MHEEVELSGYGVSLKLNTRFQVNRIEGGDTLVLAHSKTFKPGTLKNALIKPGSAVTTGRLERFEQGEGQDTIAVYRQGPEGTSIALGVGMKDLSEIGKVSKGPKERRWYITTPAYRIIWPVGLKLQSTGIGSAWPFELVNQDGVMVMLRGPLKAQQVPRPPQLVGPGQKRVDEGSLGDSTWMELEYEYEGAIWRQRHYYGILGKQIVLVSGQAPVAHTAKMTAACEAIVKSLAKR
jgi:hypothetical protein